MSSMLSRAFNWDRIGIFASGACAVHCLIAPFLFLLMPAFAEIWAHPASHLVIAVVVLPAAATVLLRGYRKHRRHWILGATSLGVLAILVGCALPYLGSVDALLHGAAGGASGGAAGGAAGLAASGDAIHATNSALASHADCHDCCPQVHVAEDGSTSLSLPPASITTIAGSVLLVAAHIGNILSCRSCHGA
jgi:hypothetical protein